MTSIASPIQLDTQLKKKSPSLNSFEETYKTAYSHGLEAIYSIQNIDLKSVRKIEKRAQDVSENVVKSKPPVVFFEPLQLEFDFGEGFRNWIEPFFLREPIEVLGLSAQAYSCFREQGMSRLSDVLFLDSAHLQGIGQGHINEVAQKLDGYRGDRSQNKDLMVDFCSLIRTLSFDIPFKKFILFLKDYRLDHIFPLTSGEKMELKGLNEAKAEEWKQEVIQILNNPETKKDAFSALRMITKEFVIPWMNQRHGIASKEEILERIERVAKDPDETHLTLRFLEDQFTGQKFSFSSFLFESESDIYCSNESTLIAYREITVAAQSYFYQPHLRYSLDQLLYFLEKDFSRKWKDYCKELIENVLKRSSRFMIIKNKLGNREIRLP